MNRNAIRETYRPAMDHIEAVQAAYSLTFREALDFLAWNNSAAALHGLTALAESVGNLSGAIAKAAGALSERLEEADV